ncbi:hypothetical protein Krac_2387 [Ktedonobacter racemifer DSM 44963]|uniref:Uncharacterized protein n=1 Tax=Ktedonobacter racemifer DSM 44963 TaxID=485913 RepID=D6U571_KTERA|nr:hypothetical protein Krac_2387 [Ktedonobacter racemifer DSM 44963]
MDSPDTQADTRRVGRSLRSEAEQALPLHSLCTQVAYTGISEHGRKS